MTDLGELILDVLGEIAQFVWDLLPEGEERKNEDRPVPKPGYHKRPPTPDTE